jgi:Flp pilus assembly protein TadG
MGFGLRTDRRGSVSVIGAFLLFVMIGVGALAVEYGHGLLMKGENQRAADLAAYGGAVVYGNTSSSAAAQAAADNIAALNGIPAADATYALVASPTGDGNKAVQVGVTTSDPLVLAQVLGAASSVSVNATAIAEVAVNSPACIIALNGSGSGVALTGGTTVSAPGCAVASNASVSAPCGTTVTTGTVDYGGAPPTEGCNNIKPPSGVASVNFVHATTADPLAGNSDVTGATSRLTTVASLTSPSAPTVPSGTAINFGYSTSTTQNEVAKATGCTASFSSPVWTVTCSGQSSYSFGSITLSGGITVNFNTGGSPDAIYNFSGSIDDSGTALNFGPGTYNVTQGVTTGGGSTTTFGAGTFNIGQSTSACSGGGKYSICNTSSLTFGGPSTFVLAAGLYNSGGSTLVLGSGSTNSFEIGASSDGNSLYMGGGATTTLANATGAGDVFQMAGNLNVASGGGSCLTVSAAAEHDIDGYMATAGGTNLGAGIYTVVGYVGLGTNGGGDVTCGGQTIGMSAIGVTFVIGGKTTIPSGTCAGAAFCVAAGYGIVDIEAPTSGNTEDLAVIGPTSGITAGADFVEGASNTDISGAFYFPTGVVTLSGAAELGNNPAGQCLELIGSAVDVTGGSATGTTCTGLGNASAGTTVALVQ